MSAQARGVLTAVLLLLAALFVVLVTHVYLVDGLLLGLRWLS